MSDREPLNILSSISDPEVDNATIFYDGDDVTELLRLTGARPLDDSVESCVVHRVLVDYQPVALAGGVADAALADARYAWTIGVKFSAGNGVPYWEIAGWDWDNDEFQHGDHEAEVVGWLPFLDNAVLISEPGQVLVRKTDEHLKGHPSLADMVGTHISAWRSYINQAIEARQTNDGYAEHELKALDDIEAACRVEKATKGAEPPPQEFGLTEPQIWQMVDKIHQDNPAWSGFSQVASQMVVELARRAYAMGVTGTKQI